MIYGSVADFRDYHSSRGRDLLATWDDTYLEAALLVASEWIDNRYGDSFAGYPTGGYTQPRQFPRTSSMTNTYPVYVFGNFEIPVEVVNATYEAALREATEKGCLTKDYTPSEYKSVSVDGAVAVEYAMISDNGMLQLQIPIVERILSPLFDEKRSFKTSKLSGPSVRA